MITNTIRRWAYMDEDGYYYIDNEYNLFDCYINTDTNEVNLIYKYSAKVYEDIYEKHFEIKNNVSYDEAKKILKSYFENQIFK